MRFSYILAALFLVSLTSCSSISKHAKQDLKKPVNCGTAQQDIATLKNERASVGQQTAAGVSDVVPVGAVINILDGNWVDGAKVASGEYNKQIDAKIKQIEGECSRG